MIRARRVYTPFQKLAGIPKPLAPPAQEVVGGVACLVCVIQGDTCPRHGWADKDTIVMSQPRTEGLTPREQSVANHLCLGLTSKEIGRKLGLTEATIKVHLKSMYKKLKVHNRVSAVMALKSGELV